MTDLATGFDQMQKSLCSGGLTKQHEIGYGADDALVFESRSERTRLSCSGALLAGEVVGAPSGCAGSYGSD
jgi:hypothetical protein